jgi:hypothetical protein
VRKIQILDLPAAAVEIADDELDVITGAEMSDSGYLCSALDGGRSDCWKQ